MMFVSQIIIPYTLNLYSAACQLYFNKSEGKKKSITWAEKVFSGIYIAV